MERALMDSGERREFSTGAVRDGERYRGFFHLIRFYPLQRLAVLYEKGAEKYAPRNWEKGMPLSVFVNSAARHLFKLAEARVDEDHAAAVAWNAFGFIWTAEQIRLGLLPRELDDIGYVDESERAEGGEPSGGVLETRTIDVEPLFLRFERDREGGE